MDPLTTLSKEQANKAIAEKLAEAKALIKECEQIATKSGVTFHHFSDDNYATFVPDLATLKREYYWDQSDGESDEDALDRFTQNYGISIPGWVSSSTFC